MTKGTLKKTFAGTTAGLALFSLAAGFSLTPAKAGDIDGLGAFLGIVENFGRAVKSIERGKKIYIDTPAFSLRINPREFRGRRKRWHPKRQYRNYEGYERYDEDGVRIMDPNEQACTYETPGYCADSDQIPSRLEDLPPVTYSYEAYELHLKERMIAGYNALIELQREAMEEAKERTGSYYGGYLGRIAKKIQAKNRAMYKSLRKLLRIKDPERQAKQARSYLRSVYRLTKRYENWAEGAGYSLPSAPLVREVIGNSFACVKLKTSPYCNTNNWGKSISRHNYYALQRK